MGMAWLPVVGMFLAFNALAFAAILASLVGDRLAARRKARRARWLRESVAESGPIGPEKRSRGWWRRAAVALLEHPEIEPGSGWASLLERLRVELAALARPACRLATTARPWHPGGWVIARRLSPVVEALARCAGPVEVPLVLLYASGRSRTLRVAALRGISGNPEVFPAASLVVADIIQNEPGFLRYLAAAVLKRILDANPELIAMYASDPTPNVRLVAVQAAVRREAAPDHGRHRDYGMSAVLVDGSRDIDPRVRAVACEGLAYLSGGTAETVLTGLARDKSPDVRLAAARALAAGRFPLTAGELVQMYQSGDPRVRRLAVEAAGAMADPPVLELCRLSREGTPASRVAALRLVSCVPGPESVATIVDALANRNPFTRRHAALAAASLFRRAFPASGDPALVAALVAALGAEAHSPVQGALVDALELCGDARAVAVLEERVSCCDESDRARLVEGIMMFGRMAARAAQPMHQQAGLAPHTS